MVKSIVELEETSVVPWVEGRNRRIFGFKITPCTENELVGAIGQSINNKEQLIVASLNLHALHVAMESPALLGLHELPNTLVHMDGISTIWIGWLQGLKVKVANRTAVHDWLPVLADEAAKNQWRMYCLGSDTRVNDLAIQRLSDEAAGLVIDGRDGYFDADSDENLAVRQQIADFAPDILVVGMGMGRQEKWIVDNLDQLGDCCIITVGACLEYMAGIMPMSPRWFGPFGLETVYRLVTRPRRYAHRYLVEPWILLWRLFRDGRLSRR